MWDQGGAVKRNSSIAVGQSPGSPLRDPHSNSFELFSDIETPTRLEKLTLCWPQALRPQTGWNQVDLADSPLPHHQPVRRMSMSWSCPLWSITIKLLTTLSKFGLYPVVAPFACQSNKGILSTPKSLCPSLNSVLGYRGQIWLHLLSIQKISELGREHSQVVTRENHFRYHSNPMGELNSGRESQSIKHPTD